VNHERTTHPVVFWSCAVVGGGICLYGLHGLVGALNGITSRQFLQWFVGADLAHDLVVAPAACLVGAVIARLAPESARAQLRAAVFATAIVLAVAWAPLHGYGRATAPGNSSVQPLNYATAVLTVLIVVWLLAGSWYAIAIIRRRTIRNRPAG
jgi:hypothetical protein